MTVSIAIVNICLLLFRVRYGVIIHNSPSLHLKISHIFKYSTESKKSYRPFCYFTLCKDTTRSSKTRPQFFPPQRPHLTSSTRIQTELVSLSSSQVGASDKLVLPTAKRYKWQHCNSVLERDIGSSVNWSTVFKVQTGEDPHIDTESVTISVM